MTVTYNGLAGLPVNAGSYAVLASYGGDGNYNAATGAGSIVVTTVPLTVKADDKTKIAGEANPLLTATFTGLVGGDTFSPGIATTATALSPACTYPITVTPFTSPNYTITFVDGTLTVTPARQLCLDYDASKANNSGSTIPIKVRLCDMSGGNISSPSFVLTAVNVTPAGGGARAEFRQFESGWGVPVSVERVHVQPADDRAGLGRSDDLRRGVPNHIAIPSFVAHAPAVETLPGLFCIRPLILVRDERPVFRV